MTSNLTLRRLLGATSIIAILVQSMPAGADSLPLAGLLERTEDTTLELEVPALGGLQSGNAAFSIVFRQAGVPLSDQQRAGRTFVVTSNGKRVAEVPLDPRRYTYQVPLPANPGGHKLKAAILDSDGKCRPGIEESIDVAASRLDLNLTVDAVRLDSLPTLLGPAYPKDKPLTIWSPFGLSGASRMTSALHVSEAFALADPERTPMIDVAKLPTGSGSYPLIGAATANLKGPLDVVIGTGEDLKGQLDGRVLKEISGPYLGLFRLDGRRTVLIISGRTRADLEIASRALVKWDFKYPHARAAILAADQTELGIPALPGIIWGPDHASGGDLTYNFSELGHPTEDGGTIRIPLVSVAGQALDETGAVILRPDYIYAGGLMPGASLQAFVDDRFVGSIDLDPRGGSTEGREISIPVSELRPGSNMIILKPVMPETQKECLDETNKLPATFRGNGTVTAPWLGGGRIRSSLSSFSLTGHLNPAELERPIRIVVESSEDGTIAGALNIASRMAKAARAPLPGMTLSDNNQDALDSDLLVVGTHEWAAKVLKSNRGASVLPKDFPNWMKQPYADLMRTFSEGDAREQVLRHLADDPLAANSATLFGWSTMSGQSVVAAVFPDEFSIKEMAVSLTRSPNWDRLAGDFAVLSNDGTGMKVAAVADPDGTATSNDPDPWTRFNAWVQDTARNAPPRLGLFAFGALVALALAMRIAISRRRVRDAERRN